MGEAGLVLRRRRLAAAAAARRGREARPPWAARAGERAHAVACRAEEGGRGAQARRAATSAARRAGRRSAARRGVCGAVGLAAGAQLELDQGDVGGEREVAEVHVVEGAREEARRLGLRQPQPQPLHSHLGEAGEALRLGIAVGHEVRGGARVV